MNRAWLLKFLAGKGYTGALTLAAVAAFAEAHGLDFETEAGKSLTVETIWNTTEKVRAPKVADANELTDEEKAEGKALRDSEREEAKPTLKRAPGIAGVNKAEDEAETKGIQWTPEKQKRLQERKAYNAKAFPNVGKPAYFDDADQAEISGALVRLRAMGPYDYSQRANDTEIIRKANIGTTMTSGGATIAPQFDPSLIDLKNNLTVIQELVGITPMQGDSWTGPRRTGGLTVYAPGQGADITESNPAFDQVTMTAVQMWTLTTVSAELLNDSALNFIAHTGGEIKYAFDSKIEDIAINGDGTSTYFSYNGLRNRLLGLSATRANIAGLAIAQDDILSGVTLGDLEAVTGLLPAKWDATASWLMHKRFWTAVVLRLSNAAGGVIGEQIVNGVSRKTLFGYPIALSDSMPRYTGTSTDIRDKVTCTLGDHRQGMKIGVVNGGSSIATSDQRYFEKGVLGIRGGYRAGVLVHDVGNATATEADKAPGPIVGLLMKAS